jgi:hypothetical protein
MNLIPNASALFKGELAAVSATFVEAGKANAIQKALLDFYISAWPFDEGYYLRQYPDVSPGLEKGHFASAWVHFRHVGYFESRFPMAVQIDADWYLTTYPDVARVVKSGKLSPEDHFLDNGYREGRLPQRPSLQHRWYGARYLPGASPEECESHYLSIGYLGGAIPARPTA